MRCRDYLVEKFGEEKAKEICSEYCPSAFGFKDSTTLCGDEDENDDSGCPKCWSREQEKPENFDGLCEAKMEYEKIKDARKERELGHVEEVVEENDGVKYELIERPNGDNELKVTPCILDSGDRTQFASGAVRDMREGKGRCDLLPLDVVYDMFDYFNRYPDGEVLCHISCFVNTSDVRALYEAINKAKLFNSDIYTMLLEVAKHFEEGAKKYGDNNWRKGIPTHVYIDSAVRHYLKWLRGDKDEPHDRAFCWNILCCIWTCKHMPELNTYLKEEEK